MRRFSAPAQWLGCIAFAGAVLMPVAHAADPIPLAIAAFDYSDTSGEAQDQAAAHAARLEGFTDLLRDQLSATGKYRIVPLSCAKPRCSAGTLDAQSLTDAARQAGARLLLYGGVHKMSTLIQFGKAQVADLDSDKVVYDRTISFRGDDDNAWKRAGEFLADDLVKEILAK
jgi:Protein of unknown function (DUF2380)